MVAASKILSNSCFGLLLTTCGFALSVSAEVVPLDEEDLSEVWGQALLEFHNSSVTGYDFSRMTFNADIDISANIGDLGVGLFGTGNIEPLEGAGVAIDIGSVQLGRSDASESQRLVYLNNPYVEFAYSNVDSDTTRRLVGMRVGFEGVSGQIGVALKTLSGSLLVDLGNEQTINSQNDPLGGMGWDGLRCSDGVTCGASLADLGVLTAGNATGPSRDFFVSVLSEPLTFPSLNNVASLPALPGIWVNWRDRLMGALGNIPPNVAK